MMFYKDLNLAFPPYIILQVMLKIRHVYEVIYILNSST